MKFRVTMKNPDALYDACDEAVKRELANLEGIDEHERESLAEDRAERLREKCSRWFQYGEYIHVEVDTDANTCVVVEQK